MPLKKVLCLKTRQQKVNAGFSETEKKVDYLKKLQAGSENGGSITCEKDGGGTIEYFYFKASTAPVGDKWKCNGSGPCVKDSSGTYNSKSECEAATACDSGGSPTPPVPTTNCKSKTPWNAITDMGMNFRDVQNKWQNANCNGTTPCVKGTAATNINLRNAVCDGTWNPNDSQNQNNNQDNQNQGTQGGKMTEEKQLEFFVSLTGTGRVYDGYVHKFDKSDTLLKDGSILKYCYAKKFECTRNDQGKIVAIGEGIPIFGKSDVTYSPNHIFILLFPDLSYVYMDKRGSMVTSPSFTWTPGNAVFSESRKRKRLSEQNIDFSPILGSSWNFNPTGTVGGASSSSQTTTGGPDPKKVKEVIDPIKNEAIQILEGMKGFADSIGMGDEIQQAINLLKSVDSSAACEASNLQKIKEGQAQIDKILKDKQAALIFAPAVKEKLERLKVLLQKVVDECKKMSTQTTSGGTGSGGSTSTTSSSSTVVTGSRKDELRKLFGFVDEDGNTMSPKTTISKMNKNPEKGFVSGMGSLQYAINNYEARSEWFEDFNELMDAEGLSDFKLKFPDNFEDEEYAGEEIDKENYSALTPIKSDAKSQYKKFTFGDFLGNESRLPIFQVQSGSGEFGVKKTKCSGNPRQKLINYLNAALSGSMSFRGSNELDYFERCLATNKLQPQFENEGPLRRSDFTEVDPDKLPFNAFNNKLGLKEIIRLLRGEEVNGAEIENGELIDKDFYTERFSVYESVKKTVKKNLSEAITKKKNLKLTESALTKILTNIKRKGY